MVYLLTLTFLRNGGCQGQSFHQSEGGHTVSPSKGVASIRCSDGNKTRPDNLEYGKCYYLTSTEVGEQLGTKGYPDYWYRFGDPIRNIPMQVCHDTSDCSLSGVVESWSRWYFKDMKGSWSAGHPAWPGLVPGWYALGPLSISQPQEAVMLTGEYTGGNGQRAICMRPYDHKNVYKGFELAGDKGLNFVGDARKCIEIWFEEKDCEDF